MKINFKHALSQKSIYIAALSACLISVAAFAVLSFLITRDSRKNNEEFARKIFFRQYETTEKEFRNIEDYQYLLRALVQKDGLKNYKDYSSVLNEVNKKRKLVPYSWYYYYNDSPGSVSSNNILSDILKNKEKVEKSVEIKNTRPGNFTNYLITHKDSIYWLSYDSLVLSNKKMLYYGSAVSLDNLHEYFTNIEKSPNHYTYVFTKEGICITHPEKKYLGKNIFDFTDIKPQDTLAGKTESGYTERNTISEYLGLEVIRFIKPLKTDNFEGYAVVNYVNFLIDENVNQTKTYTIYIFLAALVLIVTVFILFYRSTNIAYREKEKIESEKNLLLIENEKMYRAEVLNQLQQLKNNINPHFLFNSLNSLYMLIGLDRENAQKFTMNLSKIYRYLIVPPKENIVPVSQEISFIKQYMDLLKSRFDEEISFELIINDEESLEKRIPYLSLQLVTENAIKHNIATIDHPLAIIISVEKGGVIVRNTWQPKKEAVPSERFGLDYLTQIYGYFKNNNLKLSVENGFFICFLPLVE
ncbi:two-component system LytT family sensor kinase [Chryseobacterium sp. H1D6B]|uniref:histidine kinase n=1 Tax=Chryseobacterium sp. H1D6B TaxID=2940588 RepID=UPI0015CE2022|nr:histidine kinase [Chryseobacterium sp. H1D6B]MDH6253433.1 two-component system LytT family sensor kinase [Chryseobacterium sp. H1D6B]